jgi:Spy/CpxP family protein refolding chaperone
MKNKNNVPVRCFSLMALLLLAGAFTVTKAQTPPQNPAQEMPVAQATQAPNLQAELNLTPDQIQKWRALNRELREQEQSDTLRLRQARQAYADALESPNPNEDTIKQRAKELADAQSTKTQLEALRQARVLQILTPDQRVKLREIQAAIRERNQAAIRERNQALRGGNQQLPRNGLGKQGGGGAQRNANAAAPLTPKPRKLLKQTTKP